MTTPAQTLFVVKIGGNVIDSPPALERFLSDFAALAARAPATLAHGGGKLATELARRLGVETRITEGRRITDAETLRIVTMVYAGLVNKTIVAGLQALGTNALGLTGADAAVIRARKRSHPTIDYGFVGDIEAANAGRLLKFLSEGLVPVIAPITHDGRGGLLNTNADTMASAVASALAGEGRAVRLLYCFEKKGVLERLDDENSALPRLAAADYAALKERGVIAKGMIPKLDNAFAALQAGVESVRVCSAENLLAAAFEEPDVTGAGTTLSLERLPL